MCTQAKSLAGIADLRNKNCALFISMQVEQFRSSGTQEVKVGLVVIVTDALFELDVPKGMDTFVPKYAKTMRDAIAECNNVNQRTVVVHMLATATHTRSCFVGAGPFRRAQSGHRFRPWTDGWIR